MAGVLSASGSGAAYGCGTPTTGDRSHLIRENMASSYFYTSGASNYFTSAGSAVPNSVNLAMLNLSATGDAVRAYMTPVVPTGYYRLTSTTVLQGGGWPYYQWTANDVQELVNAGAVGSAYVFGEGSTA